MLKNYVKLALRSLGRHKLYGAINIVGLAIGLAGCLLAVLFIRHELSFDTYHEKADQIYRLVSLTSFGEGKWSNYVSGDPIPEMRTAYPDVDDAVKVMNCGTDRIAWHGDVIRDVKLLCSDSNLFDIFSFNVVKGDPQTALDRPNTAVITRSLAEQLFGQEEPIGQTIPLDFYDGEMSFEITGLMDDVPSNTHFTFDLLLSYASLSATSRCLDCGAPMYALLHSDADPESVADRTLRLIRDSQGKETVDDLRLEPLADVHFSDIVAERQGDIRYVYLLSAVALVILLMACANYVNLATARMMQRGKEVGVRKVLGAQRGQVVRQYLLETFSLGLLALPLSLLLFLLAIPLFNTLLGTTVTIGWGDLAAASPVALAMVAIISLMAGSYPAFFLSSFRPVSVLRGRFDRGLTASGMRKGLVVFQFLAAIVLVVFTLVVLSQMRFIQQMNLGFESEHVVLVTIADPELSQSADVLKQEFIRNTSVLSASAGTAPGQERFPGRRYMYQSEDDEDVTVLLDFPEIDSDYLATLDINLVAGRNLGTWTPGDTRREALANRATMQAMGWEMPEQAIGQTIAGDEIVGIVEDFHGRSLHQDIGPLLMSQRRHNRAYQLILRIRGHDIPGTLAELERTWDRLNTEHPFEASFLQDELNDLYENERHAAQAFGLFSGLSILIACLGLFGLAALNAERRTKEIGIRKVLGASVRSILGLFFRDVAALVAVAFVLAVPLAYLAAQRWLDDFAYRVEVAPAVFAAAGAAALLIALASTGSHAVRAALSNPADSLRHE